VDTCTLSHLAGVMKTTVVVRQTAVSAWHSTVHSPWPALGGFTTCNRLMSALALLASYPPLDRFPSTPSPRCAGGARQYSCSPHGVLLDSVDILVGMCHATKRVQGMAARGQRGHKQKDSALTFTPACTSCADARAQSVSPFPHGAT